MSRRVLDTNVLGAQWARCGGHSPSDKTVEEATDWARRLIELHRSDAIVTPIYVEFVALATTRQQLMLARAYLAQFRAIDRGVVPPQDWAEARRLAEWIPPNGRRRQLGDCLVRAIANRLGYDVLTFDSGFPRGR